MRFLPFLICGFLSFSVYSQNEIFDARFDPSANNFDQLIICPALNQPTAMPFLSFGGNCFIRSLNQIRVVAPEMDAIINSSQNPALLHQPSPYQAVNVDYSPWQTAFTANTDYALKVSLQKQFRKGGSLDLQYENFSIAPRFRFLKKNEFNFTPNMQLARLAYAKAISKHWSLGVAAKYASQSPTDDFFFIQTIQSANVLAADVGFKYQNSKKLSDYQKLSWQWGFSLSNFGAKVASEADNNHRQPLPTLLSAGFLLEQSLLLPHTASLRIRGAYQVNKLLTPAFCDTCDENLNAVPDYLEHSALKGMLVSFTDAPGGLGEELQEINHQFDMGATYMFNDKFGLRTQLTLFYQHPDKGDLQYLATQLGVQSGKFQLNFTYYSPFYETDSGRMGVSMGYQHFLTRS